MNTLIIRLVSVLAGVLLVAACTVEVEADITVRDDDTGAIAIDTTIEFGEDFPVPPEVSDEFDEDEIQAELEREAAELGIDPDVIDVSTEQEDRRVSVNIRMDPVPIEAIGPLLTDDSMADEGVFQELAVTRDGDTVEFRGVLPSLGAFGDDFGDDLPLEADEIFSVLVRLQMPGEVTEHNADEVEGNTLIWRADTQGPKEVFAESDAAASAGLGLDGLPLGLIGAVVAGLVVLLLIVLLIVLLARRGKKQPAPAAAGGWPPPGGAPQPGAPAFQGAPPPPGAPVHQGAPPPPQGAPPPPPGASGPPQGAPPPPPGAPPPPQGAPPPPPQGAPPPPPQQPASPPPQQPTPPSDEPPPQKPDSTKPGSETIHLRPGDLPPNPDKPNQ